MGPVVLSQVFLLKDLQMSDLQVAAAFLSYWAEQSCCAFTMALMCGTGCLVLEGGLVLLLCRAEVLGYCNSLPGVLLGLVNLKMPLKLKGWKFDVLFQITVCCIALEVICIRFCLFRLWIGAKTSLLFLCFPLDCIVKWDYCMWNKWSSTVFAACNELLGEFANKILML